MKVLLSGCSWLLEVFGGLGAFELSGFRAVEMRLTIIRALIVRIGFWGPLYHNYNKETPK